MPLETYRKKRNFSTTAEPRAGGGRGGRIFVVQLHHASRRHYDFRLELDGALKSWAVPKGPSFDPAVKRLAVEVEDHPISYATFEGDIPEGNYGAGHVHVFDSGTWKPVGNAREGLRKGELKFTLHGDVLRGSWVLVRTRKQAGKQQWLLIKHRDAFAGLGEADDFVDADIDPPGKPLRSRKATKSTTPASKAKATSRTKPGSLPGAKREKPAPGFFAPELCRSVDAPPAGGRWLHEIKWDGYRILASVVRGKIRLWSRNAVEWTDKLPEVVKAVAALKLRSARLDGEIIALRDGKVDFNALQSRFSDEPATVELLYMLFDVVHAEGQSFAEVPLIERKRWLAERIARHPHPLLRYSDHQIDNGAAAFAQAVKAGIEGIVSKRVDSDYSGTRSGAWVKSKSRLADEFIVVGFTEAQGSRSGLGALLLGKPAEGNGLRYVGRVGTGIGVRQLIELRRSLDRSIVKKASADPALMAPRDRRLAIWVQPKQVVEVYYQGIGGKGLLRQPAFKALRPDRRPGDVSARTEGESLPMTTRSKKAATKHSRAPARKRAASKSGKPARPSTFDGGAEDVTISHPGRIVYPALKLTKQDVADYYRAVAPWLLAGIGGRPLAILRCPDGTDQACFFQKHVTAGVGSHVHGVRIRGKTTVDRHLCIDDAQGLLQLVQMNVLEFHPWGARSSDVEHADRIVFDLDPHASVKWLRTRRAARALRTQLDSIGLRSYLRTSGGKGLHVVVPLDPPVAWEHARRFAQAVAEAMADLRPQEFVSVSGERNRRGKIFIDWLRNGRGATSVASYSLRARPTAGVAMPLDWDDLSKVKSGDAFTLKTALKWIARRKSDPWADIGDYPQSLPKF